MLIVRPNGELCVHCEPVLLHEAGLGQRNHFSVFWILIKSLGFDSLPFMFKFYPEVMVLVLVILCPMLAPRAMVFLLE